MLLNSDAARIPLEDKSVHCVTTSPPYWGLRKYSGEQGRGIFPDLGLESTPGEFIHNMVEIFREVRRVLRDDGVVWLNLGDSFAGSGKGTANYDGPISGKQKTNVGSMADGQGLPVFRDYPSGNLMLMPHRVVIALQNDGWIVRNDVVWWKRNPMPESQAGWRWVRHKVKMGREDADWNKLPKGWDVGEGSHDALAKGNYRKDGEREQTVVKYADCSGCEKCEATDGLVLKKGSWRHTRAHEFVFMLSKKMQYWSNQEAVKERSADPYDDRKSRTKSDHKRMPSKMIAGMRPGSATYSGRNPRSVLDIPTAPYKGAHYATFPPNLIVPLIRATCPRWACPICGQGWSPVVERGEVTDIPGEGRDGYRLAKAQSAIDDPNIKGRSEGWMPNHFIPSNVKGYRPTCEHPHTIKEAVPGIVLDPFIGSGTTGAVARELQRRWIGLDISMEYIDLQAKVRTKSGSPSNGLDGLPLFDKELV